jgi:hypothetical protein
MKVLVACECSGIVRDAFARRGHEAISIDLLPSERRGNHIQGSVLAHAVATGGWDLMVAFPDCTFLTISANAWAQAEWRVEARLAALHFVRALWAFPVPRIAIENPIGVLGTFWRPPDQIVQPYEYGHDASKSTCLWLKNLPQLVPTQQVPPRMVDGKPRWGNQADSGQNNVGETAARWMDRARTYEGIADAMAEQWGDGVRRERAAAPPGFRAALPEPATLQLFQ